MAEDFDRVQRNVQKMISLQAPTADIDGYLQTEGMTPEVFKSRIIERKGDKTAANTSYLEGFKASVNPLGLGDEVAAAGMTVGQRLGNVIAGEKMPFAGWGAEYDKALAERRGMIDRFREENPVMGVVSSALGSGAIKAPAPGAVPATMRGRALQTAKEGAKMGAIYGATEGEGGASSRLAGAAGGAALGGALGGVATPVVEGVIGSAQSLKGKLVEKFGGQEYAWQRKLAEALKRGEISPEQARAQLAALGPEGMIADIPAVTPLATGVAARPGTAQQQAISSLEERAGGRGERLLSNVGAEKEPVIDALDKLQAQARANSRPIYQASVNPENVLDDATFAPIKGDEYLTDLIKSVKASKLHGMKDFEDASMPVLDQVKKTLDDRIKKAKIEAPNEARLLNEKLDTLVSAMEKETGGFPAYKQAKEAFKAPMRVREAMDRGTNILKERHQLIARDFAKMSEEEQKAFQIGAKEALSDLISTDFNAAAAKFGDSKDIMWKKLRAVFPDMAEFEAFKRSMQAEMKMQANERLINPKVGPATAMRLGAAEDAANDPGKLIEGARQIATGDKISGLMKIIGGARDYLNRPSAAVAEGLAPRIFSKDQAANAQTLGLLDSIVQGQAMSDARKQLLARQAARMGGIAAGDNQR